VWLLAVEGLLDLAQRLPAAASIAADAILALSAVVDTATAKLQHQLDHEAARPDPPMVGKAR
jgi:hypothetical protein